MKVATEAAGAGLGSWLGTGSVSVVVSSSLNTFCAHKRYSTGLTIAEFKCKLELVVGSPASCMDLELYGAEEELLGRLDCDEALLGSYPVADGCRVHSPFGPSCASSVGDIMTLRGRGAGPRKQCWRPPSPSVPVAKSGYWDNPPNLPPSCLWAKPTSSQATGWVSAMMSRWASMTAGGERAWRAVCCSQWAGELRRRRRCRKEWPMGG
ncbi:uncharacterized protein ACIBXB_006349 isoform 5-T5 [Morphnus guianensis]